MLILPYTDALWVYFYQLGKRVRQPPSDRNSASHGDVIIRKFISGNFTRGINGRSSFRHHENLQRPVKRDFLNEKLGFTRGRSVSDRNRLNMVSLYHRADFFHRDGGFFLWSVWINGLIMKQIAFFIKTNHLTARSIPWVYG